MWLFQHFYSGLYKLLAQTLSCFHYIKSGNCSGDNIHSFVIDIDDNNERRAVACVFLQSQIVRYNEVKDFVSKIWRNLQHLYEVKRLAVNTKPFFNGRSAICLSKIDSLTNKILAKFPFIIISIVFLHLSYIV